MKKSKEPFDRELFYKLIKKEDWDNLYDLIDDHKSVNITEEDLRLAFGILPKKYTFRNLYNWENRFTVDFLREFKDRFTYRIFECVRPKQKSGRVIEEFEQYWPENAWISYDEIFTDALKYPHDMKYIRKYNHRFKYHRIFNYWGNREKFNLSDEEIKFLQEHKREAGW